MIHRITRQAWFWILLVVLAIGCSAAAIQLFPKAFPVVQLDIRMSRQGAMKTAANLAKKNSWGPTHFEQAATFDLDSTTQNFIELSAGGSDAFAKMVSEKLYSPYEWKIRNYAEGQTNETEVRFTPEGIPEGFSEKLAETDPGPALDSAAARKIAENTAKEQWNINFSDYDLIEKSSEKKPSLRVDHTFSYKRKGKDIHSAYGDAEYRLRLMVGGNHLTDLTHYVKVPESFERKYSEMRSLNDLIASGSMVAALILYLLLGCGLGLFFLHREHWLSWRGPLILAAAVGFLLFADSINHLPLDWMNYDTAISRNGFLIHEAVSAFGQALLMMGLLAIFYLTGESLSRRAFPQHPQLWKVWSGDAAGTTSILGRTIGGFLGVAVLQAYVVVFYLIAKTHWGWWNPSDTLFHPDEIATYFPWLTSIAQSLQAGTLEECLFRAVPLAGAALIGQRFGHRKKWLIGAFILQALVFASAHANYPAEPAYARVVELIIPSCVFGGVYLLFGLLPGIIMHFSFDVVSFAIPLFAASTPRIWLDRAAVILVALVPLWVALYFSLRNYFRTGKWPSPLSQKFLNQSWSPEPKKSVAKEVRKLAPPQTINRALLWGLAVLSVIGMVVWSTGSRFEKDAPGISVTRTQAIQIAQTALLKTGVKLTDDWTPLAAIRQEYEEESDFVWNALGSEVYHTLMGTTLMPPVWRVRFVRFQAPVADRAEEYQVFIVKNGEVFKIRHELPEARAGVTLSEEQARKLSENTLQKSFGLKHDQMKELSHEADKLPNRTDWLFTFSDLTRQLKQGEARLAIRISGNEVAAFRRFVYVPEEWQREERQKENLVNIVKPFCLGLLFLGYLIGVFAALLSAGKKVFSKSVFRNALLILLGATLIYNLNAFPSHYADFSTVRPWTHQIFGLLVSSVLFAVLQSVAVALILGYVFARKPSPTLIPASQQWIAGLSVGVTASIIFSGYRMFFHNQRLTLGNYESADFYLPSLGAMHSITMFIFSISAFMLLGIFVDHLTNGGNKKSKAAIALLCAVGFLVSGSVIDQHLWFWLVTGPISALGLWLMFRFLVRYGLGMLPIVLSVGTTLALVKNMILAPYPGAQSSAFLAIILVWILAYYWSKAYSSET